MWRRSKKIQRMIRYFREGFMHTSSNRGVLHDAEDGSYGRQCISDKVKTINLIYAEKSGGMSAIFRACWSITEIEEALYDYEDMVDDYDMNLHQTELPLLVTTHPPNNPSFITIVN